MLLRSTPFSDDLLFFCLPNGLDDDLLLYREIDFIAQLTLKLQTVFFLVNHSFVGFNLFLQQNAAVESLFLQV